MRNELEKFGADLSLFFKGLLGDSTPIGKSGYQSDSENILENYRSFVTDFQFDKWAYFPPEFKIWGDINSSPNLKGGNLLVVHLATNTCYMVDPETEEITFLFTLKWGPRPFMWRAVADCDGNIYCSYSGTVSGYDPQKARFNYWGAVVKINHKRGTIETLAETQKPGVGPILDPHGMQNLDPNTLLVADFQGFFEGGAIYTIDKNSGAVKVLSQNGKLVCPVNALKDEDGIIWVANADMSKENDGEVIKILPNGEQEVFLPKGGKDSGQLVGVLQSNKKDELIITRCEWPSVHGNSAIFKLNKTNKEITYLFRSSILDPRFYNTNGDVSGDVLWFGESIRKEIVGYNLKTDKIIKTIDFSGIAGKARGMVDSYDGIESITIIPEITSKKF